MFEGSFCLDPLWDLNVTWNTHHPDFTQCFHKSILTWIPMITLVLLMPWEIQTYTRSKSRDIPWTILNLFKILVISSLIILLLLDSILYSSFNYAVEYAEVVVSVLSYFVSLVLLFGALKFGIQSSVLQFYFYLIATFCKAITVRKAYYDYDEDAWIHYAIFGCILSLALANCTADGMPRILDPGRTKNNHPSPRLSSSHLSKLTFSWSTYLFIKGYRKPLTNDDLWDLDPALTSELNTKKFDHYYDKQGRETRHNDIHLEKIQLEANFSKKKGSVDFTPISQKTKSSKFILMPLLKGQFTHWNKVVEIYVFGTWKVTIIINTLCYNIHKLLRY